VRLVYLKGDIELISRRISARHEHFMPPSLLKSQFEALEEPGPDEHPLVASVAPRPREIVANILAELQAEQHDEKAAANGGDPLSRQTSENTELSGSR